MAINFNGERLTKFCCDNLKKNYKDIEWHNLKLDGKDYLVMPIVNDKRISYCYFCGTNIRSIMIDKETL